MKQSKYQPGFGVIEVVLIIVILGIVGFFGWFAYNRNKAAEIKTDTANTQINNTVESKVSATDEKTLDIKEWGVRVSLTKASNLTGVTYKLNSNTVVFNSDQQQDIKSCGNELNPETAWGIKREAASSLKNSDGSAISDSSADSGSAYKHIGNYYFTKVYPMAGCEAAGDRINPIDTAYTSVFESLKQD